MGGGIALFLLLALPTIVIGGVSRFPKAMMFKEDCKGNPCPCTDKPQGPCGPGERCLPQPGLSSCAYSCEPIPAQEECCQPPQKNGYDADHCSHRGNANCKANEACCFDGCRNVCQSKYNNIKQ